MASTMETLQTCYLEGAFEGNNLQRILQGKTEVEKGMALAITCLEYERHLSLLRVGATSGPGMQLVIDSFDGDPTIFNIFRFPAQGDQDDETQHQMIASLAKLDMGYFDFGSPPPITGHKLPEDKIENVQEAYTKFGTKMIRLLATENGGVESEFVKKYFPEIAHQLFWYARCRPYELEAYVSELQERMPKLLRSSSGEDIDDIAEYLFKTSSPDLAHAVARIDEETSPGNFDKAEHVVLFLNLIAQGTGTQLIKREELRRIINDYAEGAITNDELIDTAEAYLQPPPTEAP